MLPFSAAEASAIPLATRYYLLCYAWDVPLPRRRQLAAVQELPPGVQPALGLLTRLLLLTLAQRQRRGVAATYEIRELTTAQPRGRIRFAALARAPANHAVGQLPCRFQALTISSGLHRVVATALHRLLALPPAELPPAMRGAVRAALAPLATVALVVEKPYPVACCLPLTTHSNDFISSFADFFRTPHLGRLAKEV